MHKALKLIARGKLTFDESVVVNRVEPPQHVTNTSQNAFFKKMIQVCVQLSESTRSHRVEYFAKVLGPNKKYYTPGLY